MSTLRERIRSKVAARKRNAQFIVEYHPKGRVDKLMRIARNKLTFGFNTRVIFEEDPHEHPQHGRVYGTTVRNGTPFGN